MRIVRVAICQLESHPALYSGHVAYPEEPFFPTESGSLSRLGVKGIDVHALQDHCRTEYVAWARARVESIVDFLSHLDPPPDLVLFPEGGVPLEALALLKSWSASRGVTVLAGTHTPVPTNNIIGLRRRRPHRSSKLRRRRPETSGAAIDRLAGFSRPLGKEHGPDRHVLLGSPRYREEATPESLSQRVPAENWKGRPLPSSGASMRRDVRSGDEVRRPEEWPRLPRCRAG